MEFAMPHAVQLTDCHGCIGAVYSSRRRRSGTVQVLLKALPLSILEPRRCIRVESTATTEAWVASDVASATTAAAQEAMALARAAAQAARDAVALSDILLPPDPPLPPSSSYLSFQDFPSETDWLTLERARLSAMELASIPDFPFLSTPSAKVLVKDISDLPSNSTNSAFDGYFLDPSLTEPLPYPLTEKVGDSGPKSKWHDARLMKRHRGKIKAAAEDLPPESSSSSLSSANHVKSLLQIKGSKKSKSKSKSKLLTAAEEVELAQAIQEFLGLDAIRISLQEQMGREPTPVEWAKAAGMEVATLSQKVTHGQKCKDKMIQCNLRLVFSIARKYQGRGVPLQDLIQEGGVGLIRSCEKFDPSRGFKFSTYAHWWIRQGVSRSIAEHSRTVRLPLHLCEIVPRIGRAKKMLQREHKRAPREDEVAKVVGVSIEKLRMIMRASRFSKSIDKPIGPDVTRTFADFLTDENVEDPELAISKQLLKRDIEKVVSLLKPREKEVVCLRYGLGDGRMRTLEEIGRVFGVTRERIRQIEARAMRKLRQPERNKVLQAYCIQE